MEPSTLTVITADYDYMGRRVFKKVETVTQPLQWSSEYADTDLGLVYYNYRHYNPLDGRWTGRDKVYGFNLYYSFSNQPYYSDVLGNTLNTTIENKPLVEIMNSVNLFAITTDMSKMAIAEAEVVGVDRFAYKQENNKCCVRVEKAKKLVVNVMSWIPVFQETPSLHNKTNTAYVFSKEGYEEMKAHEAKRRRIYAAGDEYFLQPAESELATTCGWVCKDSKSAAEKELADYLEALRSEAVDKFNSFVVKEQRNAGIENKSIGFSDEQIIAKANNISGSFSVKKRTIPGFNFHYEVQLPGPVSWKTGCPK